LGAGSAVVCGMATMSGGRTSLALATLASPMAAPAMMPAETAGRAM
jgi:hypothetical protein